MYCLVIAQLLTLCRDPAGADILRRPPNPFPGSRETFALAHKWLHQCFDSNEGCPGAWQTNIAPRRFIQVDGTISNPSVRLASTDILDAPIPYAALSYYWGGEQRHILSAAVTDTWQLAIPYHDLPQTIKDAIHVTRELGLRYIWVNAICIIQDNLKDKQEEIEKMSEIYERAYVTIAVARAKSVEEGFLHPVRQYETIANKGFKLPYRCSSGEIGSITILDLKPEGEFHVEPLDKRGWTLQERMLSPRLLIYGTEQVRWHCQSEDHVDGWTLEQRDDGFRSFTAFTASDSKGWGWRDLVSHYTTRHLTDPRDKLLALSAVARRCGQTTGDFYVAGLWRFQLEHDLLWYCRPYDVAPSYCPYHGDYRAPSCSWASVDRPVSWGLFHGNRGDTDHASILDVQVETVPTTSRYGSIVAASLTLSGYSCTARVTRDTSLFHLSLKQYFPAMVYFDLEDDHLDENIWTREVLFVCIGRTTYRAGGLVLEKIENTRYRRIAAFSLEPSASSRIEWEKRTVTIVYVVGQNKLRGERRDQIDLLKRERREYVR